MKFGKQAVENNRFRLMAGAGIAALALATTPAFAQDAGQDEGGDDVSAEEAEPAESNSIVGL